MAEVRPARPQDAAAIRAVLTAAFGGDAEADLVAALERDGDVLAAFVAEAGGRIAGHVGLSRMEAPFAAAALAPLAVAPEWQRRGFGAMLVRAAVAASREAGCRAVFVVGDPAYYGRFGFSAEAAAPFVSPYAGRHFMALALDGGAGEPLPAGRITHARAFG